MITKSERKALIDAVYYVGGQTALAKKCGVKQQTVYVWLQKGIPPKRVLQVEKATNGTVSRTRLKPMLYPAEDYNRQNLRKA